MSSTSSVDYVFTDPLMADPFNISVEYHVGIFTAAKAKPDGFFYKILTYRIQRLSHLAKIDDRYL